MTLITYKSLYGSSERYARELGLCLSIPVSDITEADTEGVCEIIHFGGLYHGTLCGLKEVLRKLGSDIRLTIVSVGLADPEKPQNAEKISHDLQRIIPEEVLQRTRIFHLRGAMDYSRLSPKHRAMMWMLCRWIWGRKERSEEDQMVLDTYGSVVDFIDLESLDPLVSAIEAWRQ